jgi:hypothetical protein
LFDIDDDGWPTDPRHPTNVVRSRPSPLRPSRPAPLSPSRPSKG